MPMPLPILLRRRFQAFMPPMPLSAMFSGFRCQPPPLRQPLRFR
jgi:hypothetical protein